MLRAVETGCWQRFLEAELNLFPSGLVVALGGEAGRRSLCLLGGHVRGRPRSGWAGPVSGPTVESLSHG